MNKMTSKQYLIDLTLKSLRVAGENKSPSKIMCEIHSGDAEGYITIKLQPILKNGVAMFYEERTKIPYVPEIALVFKQLKARKEIFLGHYSINAKGYLQQKKYSVKLNEKLEGADAWIDFQIKIIDKQLFCDEESDDLDDESLLPTAKSIYSDENHSRKSLSDYKAKSEFNTPFVIIKRSDPMVSTPLPEQFGQSLLQVEDILQKHRLLKVKEERMQECQRLQGKSSERIQKLEQHLEKAKLNAQINTYIAVCLCAVIGFFTGLMIKSL